MTIITFGSLFSIFIFYLRRYHLEFFKNFVNNFFDVNRISENQRKTILMRELVEKKTGVSFRYINLRTFVLLPIFVFAMKIEYSYLMLLVSFCIIFHNVYLFRLKRAINLVEIPPDIFLKPSKTSLKI